MKKYCPFCDSELPETLWCERCKRYVILYNTYASDRNTDTYESEAERKELYRRLTAALKSLRDTRQNIPQAGTGGNIPRPAAAKTVSTPVPKEPASMQKRDTPKLIMISALLLIFFLLCLGICVYLISGHSSEQEDSPGYVQRETESESVPEPLGTINESTEESPETTESSAEVSDVSSPEIPAEPAEESGQELPAETDTSGDWEMLESLTPTDMQIYGDYKYYYYEAEDIEDLGIQCTYYHLDIDCDTVSDVIRDYFADDLTENNAFDATYANTYVDMGSQYYTMFQNQIQYDSSDIQCYINYDTGSHIIHYVAFTGVNIEDYAELIQSISALASPEFTVSAETLRENILSVKDILSRLDPPDPWHEEYVYQDSHISLSMTYGDGVCELQITSKIYAEDTVQGTLSINRPK